MLPRHLTPARLCMAAVLLLGCLSRNAVHAQGTLVKITPLGSHSGELCSRDRALLLEDPTGVRILYDPGFMLDETDARLGDVHVVLLSHAHNDHIGSRRDRGGSCSSPTQGPANASSNVVTIAAVKNAVVMTANETDQFLAVKIQGVRGSPTPACASSDPGDETTVPVSAPCIAPLGVSGSRGIKRGGAAEAVRITGVQALHPNNIPAALVDTPGLAPGTTAYAGLALGYVVRFTNGLVAYFTGDTGLFGDMEHIVSRFHHPQLVVINIGPGGNGPTSLGPDEAASAIIQLIRPRTVMPSHVGEQATSGGAVRAGTVTDQFTRLVSAYSSVVVPLSDVPLLFDSEGRCVGCAR